MIEKLFVCVYIWIAQNFPVLYTYSILHSHKLTVSTAPTNVTTPAGLGHRCCNRSVLLEEKEKDETKKPHLSTVMYMRDSWHPKTFSHSFTSFISIQFLKVSFIFSKKPQKAQNKTSYL